MTTNLQDSLNLPARLNAAGLRLPPRLPLFFLLRRPLPEPRCQEPERPTRVLVAPPTPCLLLLPADWCSPPGISLLLPPPGVFTSQMSLGLLCPLFPSMSLMKYFLTQECVHRSKTPKACLPSLLPSLSTASWTSPPVMSSDKRTTDSSLPRTTQRHTATLMPHSHNRLGGRRSRRVYVSQVLLFSLSPFLLSTPPASSTPSLSSCRSGLPSINLDYYATDPG